MNIAQGGSPVKTRDFPAKQQDWATKKAEYNDNGLEIDGHPVMQPWEDGYMAELAKFATRRGGHVLEIGFGMGISARHVQKHPIYKHYIIEANHDVFTLELMKFKSEAKSIVVPMLGFWQDVVGQLADASFDGILYDPYPTHQEEFAETRFDFAFEAFRLLKPGGVFTHYTCQKEPERGYAEFMYQVGFRDVDGTIVDTNPPEDCKYWDQDKIYAPLITK